MDWYELESGMDDERIESLKLKCKKPMVWPNISRHNDTQIKDNDTQIKEMQTKYKKTTKKLATSPR